MKVSLDCSQGSQDRAIAVLVFSVVLSKHKIICSSKSVEKNSKDISSYLCTCRVPHLFAVKAQSL